MSRDEVTDEKDLVLLLPSSPTSLFVKIGAAAAPWHGKFHGHLSAFSL